MSEPTLTEIAVTHSAGGKVQMIKYVQDASYFVSESRKYAIPEDWTEEQANEFRDDKAAEIRERVDTAAAKEFIELAEQSDNRSELLGG